MVHPRAVRGPQGLRRVGSEGSREHSGAGHMTGGRPPPGFLLLLAEQVSGTLLAVVLATGVRKPEQKQASQDAVQGLSAFQVVGKVNQSSIVGLVKGFTD